MVALGVLAATVVLDFALGPLGVLAACVLKWRGKFSILSNFNFLLFKDNLEMFYEGNNNQYLSVGCLAAFLTGVVVVTSSFLARGLAERKSIHNSWYIESYSRSHTQIRNTVNNCIS